MTSDLYLVEQEHGAQALCSFWKFFLLDGVISKTVSPLPALPSS